MDGKTGLLGLSPFHPHNHDWRDVRHIVPADTRLGFLRLRKTRLRNPVNNKAGLEAGFEEHADRPMEEPLGLGLPDDAFGLPRER